MHPGKWRLRTESAQQRWWRWRSAGSGNSCARGGRGGALRGVSPHRCVHLELEASPPARARAYLWLAGGGHPPHTVCASLASTSGMQPPGSFATTLALAPVCHWVPVKDPHPSPQQGWSGTDQHLQSVLRASQEGAGWQRGARKGEALCSITSVVSTLSQGPHGVPSGCRRQSSCVQALGQCEGEARYPSKTHQLPTGANNPLDASPAEKCALGSAGSGARGSRPRGLRAIPPRCRLPWCCAGGLLQTVLLAATGQ